MTNYISAQNNNKLAAERPEGFDISTVVLTYTVTGGDIHEAVTTMFDYGTSTHYTIDQNGYQVQHHSESQKAFYAGASHFHGKYGVNDYGIGIMLVNDAKSPFTDEQIVKLIDTIKDIEVRYEKSIEIVGLGEVNKKHIAPGVFFPWNKLAEAEIGKSISLPENIDTTCKINLGDSGEHVTEFQQKLQSYGYQVDITGTYDETTAKFVKNFSNRYLPKSDFDPLDNFAEQHVVCVSDATEYVISQLILSGEENNLVTPDL